MNRVLWLFSCTLIVFTLLLLDAQVAHAHVDHGEATGLATGFQHPWSGPDHVLAMLAVGLWGAQLNAPAIWVLPIVFPMVMSLGAFLGLVGLPLPGVEIGIAASAIVLGLLVTFESQPPIAIAAVIVGVFAIFHGHAHGTELPEGQSGLLYSIGFVVGTGLLHALGIAIGVIHRWQIGAKTIQIVGVMIAFGGVYYLWRSLG